MIGRFIDGPNGGYWPRWCRRAYLLTLPVSAPLWVLVVAAWFLCFLLGQVLNDLTPVQWLRRTWK